VDSRDQCLILKAEGRAMGGRKEGEAGQGAIISRGDVLRGGGTSARRDPKKRVRQHRSRGRRSGGKEPSCREDEEGLGVTLDREGKRRKQSYPRRVALYAMTFITYRERLIKKKEKAPLSPTTEGGRGKRGTLSSEKQNDPVEKISTKRLVRKKKKSSRVETTSRGGIRFRGHNTPKGESYLRAAGGAHRGVSRSREKRTVQASLGQTEPPLGKKSPRKPGKKKKRPGVGAL